ncbi:MAG: 16S rRNA (guanine(966)-N(2))-methyltransferase RsmD [Cyanobacteria bacterium NC_groundwater_1444_Ag_S-0.65um_54_12]|nr:16S rRNA (guanine(966)-N(2))-methyltransferase RsmD [Cyanobacteria bacterium NC_groundwater_1444_Ag_S-0.65um_54_12]
MRIIGGKHRGRVLKRIAGAELRPTTSLVREALFAIIGPLIKDATVLELFAGTGASSLEALSRGASQVIAVERSDQACAGILANARMLGVSARLQVIHGEVARAITRLLSEPARFTVIFADPPYAFAHWESCWDRLPDLLAPGGLLVVEHAAADVLPPGPAKLGEPRLYCYGKTRLAVFRSLAATGKRATAT